MKNVIASFLIAFFAVYTISAQNKSFNLDDASASKLRSTSLFENKSAPTFQNASKSRELVINPVIQSKELIHVNDTINLGLFSDKQYKAYVDKIDVDVNGTITIRARILNSNFGYCIISTFNGKSFMTVEVPDKNELYMSKFDQKTKKYYLLQIDKSKQKALEGAPSLIPPSNNQPTNYQPNNNLPTKNLSRLNQPINYSNLTTSPILKNPNQLTNSTIGDGSSAKSKVIRGDSSYSIIITPQYLISPNSLLTTNIESKNVAKSRTIISDPNTKDTITLMIVYTPAAAAWSAANETDINNTISLLMAKAQLALDNGNTLMTIKLVYTAQVNFSELNNNQDLYNLTDNGDGSMDDVHNWRDAFCADVVVLLENTDFTGGLGWLLNSPSGLPQYAFSLTRVQQASWTYTTIHEIGHNMGCHHHKLQNFQSGPGLYSYSAGWRWNDTSGVKYCDVMTYESGSYFADGINATRVPYFSNPDIQYQGVPTGDAVDGDNARTIRETKSVVASYRDNCSYCIPPTTQTTTFISSALSDNSMTIGWTRGNGNAVLVVARAGSAVSVDPYNETAYTANAAFGSGTQIGSGNYVVYNGTGASVNLTALTPGTTYYFSIYEYNSASNCYLTPALIGNARTTGIPPYCAAGSPATDNEYISNFSIGSINQASGRGTAGYQDYTSQIATMQIGVYASAKISVAYSYSTDQVLIWIDWNQDGDFDDAGENVYSSTGSFVSPLTTSSFAPPLGAKIGATRMRIRLHDTSNGPNATSCGDASWGEVEDYTINVTEACIPPTTKASAFTSSALANNSMTVGWTRGNGSAVLVVARADSAVNADPVNGTTYTASAAFGNGTQIGTGNYVVYNGTGTSVNLTALTGTTYYYAIYEYNSASNCYLTPALTATFTQAAFVPTAGVLYNIVQTSSNLGVGAASTQPVVQTLATAQAFEFIPVSGKTDTYYLKNMDGNYLNKSTANNWTTVYQVTVNGTNSEWVVSGTDSSSIRLMLTANIGYLASDQTTTGSALYCDKTSTNANGLFKLIAEKADQKVYTNPVSSILSTTSILNGIVGSLNDIPVISYGFCWNTTGTPTISDTKIDKGAISTTGAFTHNLSGLTQGTKYYVRAYVTDSSGTTFYGDVEEFTTLAPIDPGLSNLTHQWTFDNGTANDAIGTANGILQGGASIENMALKTSTTGDYLSFDGTALGLNAYSALSTEVWFTSAAGSNTGYTMLSYFGNTTGSYGYDYLTMSAARGDNFSRTAISCGNTTEPWNVENGVNGTEYDDGMLHQMVSVLTSTGITLYVDGQKIGTTAYSGSNAISSIGTSLAYLAKSGYSADPTWIGSFHKFSIYNKALTDNEVNYLFGKGAENVSSLVVATYPASSITSTSATLNAIISSLGSTPVTSYGFCWNTTGTPTISDTKIDKGAISATGAFTHSLSDLTQGTTYYVRAYATNSLGTVYGNELLLKTYNGTATDIDGNVYNTVTIGTQTWMVENLKTTKYNDGTPVPNVTDNTVWHGLLTPAYCWYNNDATTYKNTYGALYNWYTVNTAKLAPVGWHVPTDAEWTALENYLMANGFNYDGTTTGNKYAKSLAATTNWITDAGTGVIGNDLSKNNSTGFSSLPGGVRDYYHDGAFGDVGGSAAWWSSTQYATTDAAMFRGMYSTFSSVGRYNHFMSNGFSVRCVKDTDTLPTLITSPTTAITETSAISGGNITSDGGAIVTARGVCWSTTTNPTIANSYSTDGIGTGVFTSLLTGLTAGITYYVRAYATNSAGTSYGSEVSFTIFQPVDPGTANLTHQWTFDINAVDKNSGIAFDVVGNANGKIKGNASFENNALKTDGGYLELPGDLIKISSYKELSMEVWFRSILNANQFFTMICYFGDVTPYMGSIPNRMNTQVGSNGCFISTSRYDNISRAAISCGTLPEPWAGESIVNYSEYNDSILHHMISTINDSTIAFYIDGNFIGSSVLSEKNKINNLSNNYAFLAQSGYVGFDSTWVGSILKFNLYDKELNAGEVLYLYQNGAENASSLVVATNPASSTTSTSAVLNATISSLGSTAVTSHGFCWNTTGTPTISDTKIDKGAIYATGAFTHSLSVLTQGTKYFVRAYATNSFETAYGNEVSFTTISTLPIANAGQDQTVNEGEIVTLDGSASSDPNNDTLTYLWTVPSGITLSSTTTAKPTFTAPEVTTTTPYIFSLVVNDGTDNSPADQVTITVSNVAQSHFTVAYTGNGQDHMSLNIMTATIDGLALEAGDEIAVFDGIICSGKATLTQPIDFNNSNTFVAIAASKADVGQTNGYTVGNAITYKFWDSNKGKEYSLITSEYFDPGTGQTMTAPTFTANESAFVKLISTSLYTQEISLISGWNIISSNVIPSKTNLKEIIQPLIDTGKLKKMMDESGKAIENFGAFGGWKNNIGNFTHTEGYKVNMTDAETLILEGSAIPLPLTIPLSSGWNIISYPCANAQNAQTIVQSLINSGKLKKVMDESGKSIENYGAFGGWKNNIGNLTAGKGFKINMTGEDALTITSSELRSAINVNEILPSKYFKKVYEGNGTDHMNINLVGLESSGLQAGDEIGIFDGMVCVGSATIGNEQMSEGSISIPTSCNDEMEQTINGFTPKHAIVIKLYSNGEAFNLATEILWGSDTFENNGSLFAKVKSRIPTGFKLTNEPLQFICYPNPFRGEIQIDVFNTEPAKLTIEIYHFNGQKIKLLYDGVNTGNLHLKWNGTDNKGNQVEPGIYLCKIGNQTKKIVYIGKKVI